jgi:hypothetical protein
VPLVPPGGVVLALSRFLLRHFLLHIRHGVIVRRAGATLRVGFGGRLSLIVPGESFHARFSRQ